jgi:hypothetical protein
LSREKVEAALREQKPGRIQVYAVDVRETLFPVKQALASALQISAGRFTSARAVELLTKAGLRVVDTEFAPVNERAEDGDSVYARRARALEFAVQLHARAAERDPEAVVGTATRFDDWLSTRHSGIQPNR